MDGRRRTSSDPPPVPSPTGPQDDRRTSVSTGQRHVELGRRVVRALLIDVAETGKLEAAVGLKGRGMVHAALAHPDYDDAVLAHARPVVRSHSRVLAMV